MFSRALARSRTSRCARRALANEDGGARLLVTGVRATPRGEMPLPTPLPLLGKFLLATALAFASSRGAASVPEIAAPGLPDTAMAEMTAGGPVIFFNPALYRAAGDAREFVRAHEYGHVLLGHLDDLSMLETSAGRERAEAEADCFAARAVGRASVLAMARLVLGLPPEPRDRIYGTKPERARRILACAGVAGGDGDLGGLE